MKRIEWKTLSLLLLGFCTFYGEWCVIIIASGKYSASRHTMVGIFIRFVCVLLKFNTDILVSELPISHICLPHCRRRRRRSLPHIRARHHPFQNKRILTNEYSRLFVSFRFIWQCERRNAYRCHCGGWFSFRGMCWGSRNGQIMSNSFDANLSHTVIPSRKCWFDRWTDVTCRPGFLLSFDAVHYIWMHMNSKLPIYFRMH